MVTLLSLGRVLETRLGGRRFGILYLAGLMGGAGGYALLSRVPLPMVGASGALFGLAGAILFDRLADDLEAFSLRAILRDVLGPLIWIVLINIVMYRAFEGHLAWQAHLGGFVVGALAMAVLRRSLSPPEPL